jgi:hypothetical protein
MCLHAYETVVDSATSTPKQFVTAHWISATYVEMLRRARQFSIVYRVLLSLSKALAGGGLKRSVRALAKRVEFLAAIKPIRDSL